MHSNDGFSPRNDITINNFLKDIENEFKLLDAYRSVNPTGQDTTYHLASGLDRIYVPAEYHEGKVAHLEESLEFSDHKATIVAIHRRGKRKETLSHWKFKNSLLQTALFVELIS